MTEVRGQAMSMILAKMPRFASGQAQAEIVSLTSIQIGCAMAYIRNNDIAFGQAQASIVRGRTNARGQAQASIAPAIPTSNTVYLNSSSNASFVYVSGGTVTVIKINGLTTGLISGTFHIPAGYTITLTYSVAPSWIWFN